LHRVDHPKGSCLSGDRLKPVLAAHPDRAGDLAADQRVDQRLLVAALPYATVVLADRVINAGGERQSGVKQQEEPTKS